MKKILAFIFAALCCAEVWALETEFANGVLWHYEYSDLLGYDCRPVRGARIVQADIPDSMRIIIVPDQLGSQDVISVAGGGLYGDRTGAFANKTQIEYVYLPKTVIDIGSAFNGCSSLRFLDAEGAQTFGYSGFEECSKLKNMIIPDYGWLGWGLFSDCENMDEIVLGEGLCIDAGGLNVRNLNNVFADANSFLSNIYSNYKNLYYNVDATKIFASALPGKDGYCMPGYGHEDTGVEKIVIPAGVRELVDDMYFTSVSLPWPIDVYISEGSYEAIGCQLQNLWSKANFIITDETDISAMLNDEWAGFYQRREAQRNLALGGLGVDDVQTFYDGSNQSVEIYGAEVLFSQSNDDGWTDDRSLISHSEVGEYTHWFKGNDYKGNEVITNATLTIYERPQIKNFVWHQVEDADLKIEIEFDLIGNVDALQGTRYPNFNMALSSGDVSVTIPDIYSQSRPIIGHNKITFSAYVDGMGDGNWEATLVCKGTNKRVGAIAQMGVIAESDAATNSISLIARKDNMEIGYRILQDGFAISSVNCSELGCIVDFPAMLNGKPIKLLDSNAFSGIDKSTKIHFGGAPIEGLARSGLNRSQILFDDKYAAQYYLTRVKVLSSKIREDNPTIIDTTYRVDQSLPGARVRVLAFKDGVRSFANVVRPETFVDGTAANVGDDIEVGVDHTISWDVAADYGTGLTKFMVEVLAQDGDLLPMEWITIPKSEQYPKMKISYNAITDDQIFNALIWLYAVGGSDLLLSRGILSDRAGNVLVDGKTVKMAYWAPRFVIEKMGYNYATNSVLTFPDIEIHLYASEETRKSLPKCCAYKYID